MSLFRINFAAPIHKVEFKQAGAKSLAEVSICRKNRGKDGEEPTFTWLRISVWSPPDWMTAKMVKGAFIAGSGEFTLRTYEKDGVKRQSAECNSQSFDVEVGGSGTEAPIAAQAAAAQVRAAAPVLPSGGPDDEIPF